MQPTLLSLRAILWSEEVPFSYLNLCAVDVYYRGAETATVVGTLLGFLL